MKSKPISYLLCLVLSVVTLGCGDSSDDNNTDNEKVGLPLSLSGTWWVTGEYSGDCGDRGPWSGHLTIQQTGKILFVESYEIDGSYSSGTWILDGNNTVSSESETTQGDVTERRTATTSFLSSSIFEGVRTLEVIQPGNTCTTTNNYTGIKLENLTYDRFKGQHCLLGKGVSNEPTFQDELNWAIQLDLSGSESDVLFTTSGGPVRFNGNGTVIDDKLNLKGEAANGMTLNLLLAFAADSNHINGTLNFETGDPQFPGMKASLTGQQQSCWRSLPDGIPQEGTLPIALENITSFQVYGNGHDGIDFMPDRTGLPVYAPFDGVVTLVILDSEWQGNIMHSVRINYNEDYYVAINIEPSSNDPTVAEEQRRNIKVQPMQVVQRGDVIGSLVVPKNAEFPHIHWGIGNSTTASTHCPADFLTQSERDRLDTAIETVMGVGVRSCP